MRLVRQLLKELGPIVGRSSVPVVDLSQAERDVLLAALFELHITRSAFDDDPDLRSPPRSFVLVSRV